MTGFKSKKRFLLFVVVTLISFHCFSQDDSTAGSQQIITDHTLIAAPPPPEEIFYKGSVEGGGGTVIPITNKALRISLGGVYSLHLSGNYVVAPHVFAGLELEDIELGNLSSIAAYNTVMFIYNAGVKLGYYTYMQQDFLFCYSLSFGPSLISYRDALIPAPKQETFFVTPNMLASYRVNDELRIGVDFSVLCLGYKFNPAYTGIGQYLIYDSKNTNAITTCFEAGFGVYWAFDEMTK